MKKRNYLEQKWLNYVVSIQYNLKLRWNQMMRKTHDLDPIMLDNIDPTSEWVEETEEPVFEADFDIDMALAGDEADYVVAMGIRTKINSGIKERQRTNGRH